MFTPSYTNTTPIPFGKSLIESDDVNSTQLAQDTYLGNIDDQRALSVVTSNTTLVANRDVWVPVSTAAGNVTITLPAAANHTTQPILIQKVSQDTNRLIIQRAGSDTIDNPYSPLSIPITTSIELINPGESARLYPQPSTSYWRGVYNNNTRLVSCVVSSGSQTFANSSTTTAVQFGTGTTISDRTGMHSEVTNNTRFTVNVTGSYEVKAAIRFADNTGGNAVGTWLLRNGTTTINPQAFFAKDSASQGRRYATLVNMINLNSGDYLELIGFQDSGSTLTLTNAFISISLLV
jgi:hypothetical protein